MPKECIEIADALSGKTICVKNEFVISIIDKTLTHSENSVISHDNRADFTTLIIERCFLTREAILYLAANLTKIFPNLKTFRLLHNTIDKNLLKNIAEAVKNHPTLHSFQIYYQGIEGKDIFDLFDRKYQESNPPKTKDNLIILNKDKNRERTIYVGTNFLLAESNDTNASEEPRFTNASATVVCPTIGYWLAIVGVLAVAASVFFMLNVLMFAGLALCGFGLYKALSNDSRYVSSENEIPAMIFLR